jgi:hypothetical protein
LECDERGGTRRDKGSWNGKQKQGRQKGVGEDDRRIKGRMQGRPSKCGHAVSQTEVRRKGLTSYERRSFLYPPGLKEINKISG